MFCNVTTSDFHRNLPSGKLSEYELNISAAFFIQKDTYDYLCKTNTNIFKNESTLEVVTAASVCVLLRSDSCLKVGMHAVSSDSSQVDQVFRL